MRRILGGLVQILCIGVLSMTTSHAAPRALLIGISDYAMPDADLPGIDLDIQNTREVAAIMGFKPEEVRVLFDKEATLANVTANLRGWLREGSTVMTFR